MFFPPEYQVELLLKLANKELADKVLPFLRTDFFLPPYDTAAGEILDRLKTGKLTKAQIKQIYQRSGIKQEPLDGEQDYSFDVEEIKRYAKWAILRDAFLKANGYKESGEYEKAIKVIEQAKDSFPQDEVRCRNLLTLGNTLPKRRNVIPIGLPTLDTWLKGGIAGGNLAIIMGAANSGKSTFLVWVASKALELGKKVAYVTLEATEEEIDVKFRCCLLNQEESQITDKAWAKKVKELTALGAELKIYDHPAYSLTVDQIDKQIGSVDLLCVDYADYLCTYTGGDTWEQLGRIYGELKGLGKRRCIPVWSASQVNRAGYGDIPGMAHAEGAIKKSMVADTMLTFSQTEEESKPNDEGLCTGTIFIAKHRHGKRFLKQPITVHFGKNQFLEGKWA